MGGWGGVGGFGPNILSLLVDEIFPVSNDVFVVIYVCEVDLSGVLISRTVLKTFITIKFVQFKIEEY